MPGLDEYYKYLDKQDKTRKNGASADADRNGTTKEAKVKKPRLPEGPLPGSVQPGVRYVLRGGVTVAVPVDSDEKDTDASGAIVLIDEPILEEDFTEDDDDADLDEESEGEGESSSEVPDYLPPLVEAAAPTEVPDANARPRRRRDSEPIEELSDSDAATLWKRLPRHIQLLVGMTPETKEEPAQKYYSRGFKESRQQLIERLLDPTMTLEDTARVLGVCPTTVRRYTNRGVLPHYRTLGQQRRFRLSDVLAFLEKQQKQAARRRKMLFGDKA